MLIINGHSLSIEEFTKLVASCFNKTELATKLGFNYFNGQISKKISEIIIKYSISIDHFDIFKKLKERRIYKIIIKECPVCKVEFTTQIGNKEERQTCSRRCSNTYFASIRHTKEANEKTSFSIKKRNQERFLKEGRIKDLDEVCAYKKICPSCNINFETKRKNQICCSRQCVSKNPSTLEKLSKSVQERIKNGTHKGWQSRLKIEPSYPEKYIITLLDQYHIKYDREFRVNKWFIDFADPTRKLALEIDGKQHDYPERKLSDELKDQFLIENEWKILRIRWKKITKEFREELIKTIIGFFNEQSGGRI